MKFVPIIILAIFWHSQSIYCNDFLSVIVKHFSVFTKTLTTNFDGIFNKVKDFLQPHIIYRPLVYDLYGTEEKLNHSFHDFVKRTKNDVKGQNDNGDYDNINMETATLMSTPELANLHGIKVDTHVIITRDGYLLTLHRIENKQRVINKSVILHHGLFGSSTDWILLGPDSSLAYILNSIGYDVWMTNARGNYHSRAHVSLSPLSPEFWKFSWQEMGEYDLPAVIDYVRQIQNNTNKINFVGHSMGATALMVLLSTNPQYNEYLRIGILLAPLVFMNNVQGPLKVLQSMSSRPPTQLLKTIGNTEFLPSRKVPKMMSNKFCTGLKIFCHNPLFFFAGGLHHENLNSSFVARLLYHVPAGGSTNTILHYGQLIQNGNFHRFNNKNSQFPLNHVTLPIVLISSDDDILASMSDVLRLYFSISNPLDHHIIRGKGLSHTELVWGAEAPRWVFSKVTEYLENLVDLDPYKNNKV